MTWVHPSRHLKSITQYAIIKRHLKLKAVGEQGMRGAERSLFHTTTKPSKWTKKPKTHQKKSPNNNNNQNICGQPLQTLCIN